MKLHLLLLGAAISTNAFFADTLPVITTQPQSQTATLNGSATLIATATGATSYQWRFNGVDISDATNSSLTLANLQQTNSGYYMAIGKNATGWVPSLMAWLSVMSSSGGVVPFSNRTNTYFAGDVADYMGTPLSNCKAQVIAGPALDQMQPVGLTATVTSGRYPSIATTRIIPTIDPGEDVYYRVEIRDMASNFITHSTAMKLTAGGGSFPTPSVYGLQFPGWWVGEGLEPTLQDYSPTNQFRVPGETFTLTNTYFCYTDYGTPTAQWRKNGSNIVGATNFPAIYDAGVAGVFRSILTISNVQPSDTGIYDLVVLGNDWIVGPKTTVSIQLVNGQGVFLSPRLSGSNFVCDLVGAPTRNYAIEWSTNLLAWDNLLTVSNNTGTVAFTNDLSNSESKFFRSRLLP